MIRLEDDYKRLLEDERRYNDEIKLWGNIQKITDILIFIFVGLTIIAMMFLPDQLYPINKYLLETIFLILLIALFLVNGVINQFAEKRTSNIKSVFGLSNFEILFLDVYKTRENVINCAVVKNTNIKEHYKNLAINNMDNIINKMKRWSYGNIDLTKKLIGDEIDLLKDNMSRLVLSNIAKGNDEELSLIADILVYLRDIY